MRKIVLVVIVVALFAATGPGTTDDLDAVNGAMQLPLASHAGPATVQASDADGWSSGGQALVPAGSASTTKDKEPLIISGFAADGKGSIASVTVMTRVSQVEHYDDMLKLEVTAPGCSAVSRSLPLSTSPTQTATAVPCDWTWGTLAATQVKLTTEGAGGLAGLGRIDGAWHAHYVWLEVTVTDAAPIAIVGPDVIVNEGATVLLNGSASTDPERGALTYHWVQTSGPSVPLPASGPTATIKAPMLPTNAPAALVFKLTVTDPAGHASSATVRVDVQNINQAPRARAGEDQAITAGTVVLDGTGSSDADGDTLQFTWSQISGPSALMEGTSEAQATATPQVGTAVFRLTVADGWGGTSTDDVTVTMTLASAEAPGPGAEAAVVPEAGTGTPPPRTTSSAPGTGSTPAAGAAPGANGSDSGAERSTSPATPPEDPALGLAGMMSVVPWLVVAAIALSAAIIVLRRKRKHSPASEAPAVATPVAAVAKPERPQIVLGDLGQEERNDEIVQFLNNASHDLASPLTPIRIQLAMLEHVEGELTDKQRKAWDVVKRNIDQMGLLVGDVRDAARMQAGRLAMFPEPIDLGKLVADSVESFEGPAAEKDVKLTMDHDGSPVPVEGDAGRLTQVLYNLINNAVKFTDPGGRVQIALRFPSADQVVVAVRDTGLGMTPEDAARLFQPFSQAHDAKQKQKGSGLGLFISKGIIEGHDGDIWCESAGPGQGSVFAFSLALKPEILVPVLEAV